MTGPQHSSKRPRIGVIMEQALEVGGGFQQSLTDLIWLRDWTSEADIELVVFTPHQSTIDLLGSFNVTAQRLKPGLRDGLALALKYCGILDFLQRFLRACAPFEKRLARSGIDLVYFTTTSIWHQLLYKLPFIITVFDGCHRDATEFDEVRAFGEFERREILFRSACTRAVLVVANSPDLISDLGRRYGMEPDRAICVPFSASTYVGRKSDSGPDAGDAVLRHYGLQPGYFFYPAQFWAHKNHAILIDALAQLRDGGSQQKLVLCGSNRGARASLEGLIAQYGLSDQVSILGFVDSDHLASLYRGAKALIMPSYFGPTNLPPLEAWTVGTPVLYPEAFRSFVGDAALLFDYDDARSLADAMRRIESPELAASLRHAGEAQLQHAADQTRTGRKHVASRIMRLLNRRRSF